MNKIYWKNRCLSAEKILAEIENMETWLPDRYSEPVLEEIKEELVNKIDEHRKKWKKLSGGFKNKMS